MAQVKFLSQAGLQTVWNRIKEVFATKTSVNNLNQALTDNVGALNQALVQTTTNLLDSDANIINKIEEEQQARYDADVTIQNLLNTSVNNLAQIDSQLSWAISNANDVAYREGSKAVSLVAEGTPIGSYTTSGYFSLPQYVFHDYVQDNNEGYRITRIYKNPWATTPADESGYYFYNTGLRAYEGESIPMFYIGDGINPVVDINLPLRSVYIQSSIRTVSGFAFQDAHLQEVTFDRWGVQIIGRYSFAGNDFVSLELPASLQEIRHHAFVNCPNLQYVIFNSPRVPEITQWETEEDKQIFQGCNSLSAIYVESYLVDAYKDAWPWYAHLIQPNLGSVGGSVNTNDLEDRLYQLAGIEKPVEPEPEPIVYSEGLNYEYYWDSQRQEEIRRVTIGNCLDSIINIPPNADGHKVGAIGNFSNCEFITEVNLPNTIRILGFNAFYNCQNLTKINLNNGLQTIEEWGLESTGLIDITFPKTLTSINGGAFNDCRQLTTITCLGITPPTICYNQENCTDTFNGAPLQVIYVPANAVEAYKEAWWRYADIIQPIIVPEEPDPFEEVPSLMELASKDTEIEASLTTLESEVAILKSLINADYVNVSEVGV